jgi:uncharacterized peroxidase-related enzyme
LFPFVGREDKLSKLAVIIMSTAAETHIELPDNSPPGISGLLRFRPQTAEPLLQLAHALLHGDSTLTKGEREIIAASVSYWNGCHFCHTSHAAAAAAHYNSGIEFFDEIKAGLPNTDISDKLRALLEVAHQVQKSGKEVTKETVQIAREKGATDVEIHDTVLIAAAFCMFNRYVDGLNTWAPKDSEAYVAMGASMAANGYVKKASEERPAEEGK